MATWWVHPQIRPSAYLDRLLALVPAANFSDLACQPSRSSQTLPQHHASRHRQARQQRHSNPLALPTRISQRVDCDRLIFRRRFSTRRDKTGGTGSSIAPLGGLRPGKKVEDHSHRRSHQLIPARRCTHRGRLSFRFRVSSFLVAIFGDSGFCTIRATIATFRRRPTPTGRPDFFRVPFPVLIVINQPHASSRQPPSWRTSTLRRRRRPSR